MKYLAALVFLLASASAFLVFCQENPGLTAKAIDGAKELRSGLRDPESFKLDRVWVMHDEKHGDTVCYVYYARNGFGGMNHSAADYAPNKKGEYSLNVASDDWAGPTGNIHAIFPGGFEYFRHCRENPKKHDKPLELTEEVKKSFPSTTDAAPR